MINTKQSCGEAKATNIMEGSLYKLQTLQDETQAIINTNAEKTESIRQQLPKEAILDMGCNKGINTSKIQNILQDRISQQDLIVKLLQELLSELII